MFAGRQNVCEYTNVRGNVGVGRTSGWTYAPTQAKLNFERASKGHVYMPSPNGFAMKQRPCVLTPKPVGPGPCP